VVTVGCVRGVARCCWVGGCSQVGCKRGLFCSCGAFRYGFGDRSLVGLVTVVGLGVGVLLGLVAVFFVDRGRGKKGR
jgi:hypothetical protein